MIVLNTSIIKENEMNKSTVYYLYSSRKVVKIDRLSYPFDRTQI
jgi:hypothetical protein